MNMINRSAIFSEDKTHRFYLKRSWVLDNEEERKITFIGLNPSIANHENDDPTIRRLIGFTKFFEYNSFEIVNLYSLICTNPKEVDFEKLLNENNNHYLNNIDSHKIIFCWGKNRNWPNWNKIIKKLVDKYPYIYCFGRNKDGSPKHPLYLKADTTLEKWCVKW